MARWILTALSVTIFSGVPLSANAADIASTNGVARVLSVDKDSATIVVMNNSHKTMNAYTIAIDETYEGGQVNHHELSNDAGPNVGVLAYPGHMMDETDHFTQFPSNRVVQVDVKLIAMVFTDGTAVAADPAALQRIISNRADAAADEEFAAGIIQNTLASNVGQPSEVIWKSVNSRMLKQKAENSPTVHHSPVALMGVQDDLERATHVDTLKRTTERDYLIMEREHLSKEAALYRELTKVRSVSE
jgi:hypothetical protein